jgi:hypothetical protein
VEKTLKQRPDLIRKGRELSSSGAPDGAQNGERIFNKEINGIIDRLTVTQQPE